MKSLLIPVLAVLLTGCASSGVVCQQWKNKQISDEKAAEILGVDATPIKQTTKDAVTITHSDGKEEKSDMTITYTSSAAIGFYCLAIENGLIEPSMVWTLGK